MVATQVANQEALWIRVRLVSGGFGFFVDTTVPTTTGSITVQYVVPQPPVLADFRIGFSWQNGPEPFDRVFSYNDFGFEDRTENARWPGAPFTPFSAVADRTPAFYLGTDAALPSADAGLYFDIVEAAAASAASPLPLVWEEWDGGGWRQLTFDDDTEELTLPGIVALQPLPATAALMRFGRSLYWIRARLIDDQPPTETTVSGVVLNAVWASQQRTFQGMALGASAGAPSQVFTITQVPVLAEERIEVREFSGRRANVEWRIVALQLFDNDAAVVEALENALGAEGVATDVQRAISASSAIVRTSSNSGCAGAPCRISTIPDRSIATMCSIARAAVCCSATVSAACCCRLARWFRRRSSDRAAAAWDVCRPVRSSNCSGRCRACSR